jgi:hypothetical protein
MNKEIRVKQLKVLNTLKAAFQQLLNSIAANRRNNNTDDLFVVVDGQANEL